MKEAEVNQIIDALADRAETIEKMMEKFLGSFKRERAGIIAFIKTVENEADCQRIASRAIRLHASMERISQMIDS